MGSETLTATPSPYREISRLREDLVKHPIYHSLKNVERIRLFMKYHVFAVWDFMSLLKALQRETSCVSVPWLPPANIKVARFVNEIVLGEETDEDGRGSYKSHFELYRDAMEQCGADMVPINKFLQALREGIEYSVALKQAGVPNFVSKFVGHTLNTAFSGKTHCVAAAFFYGREDVIPDMFRNIVDDLRKDFSQLERFIYYLDRHIEVDGDDHGPRARELMVNLCEGDRVRHKEAVDAALSALHARYALWDGVYGEVSKN